LLCGLGRGGGGRGKASLIRRTIESRRRGGGRKTYREGASKKSTPGWGVRKGRDMEERRFSHKEIPRKKTSRIYRKVLGRTKEETEKGTLQDYGGLLSREILEAGNDSGSRRPSEEKKEDIHLFERTVTEKFSKSRE